MASPMHENENENDRVDGDHAFSHYYESLRTDLLDLLEPGTRPVRVLEVGCGGGANLAELKRRFPAIRTTGVEIHPEAVRAALDSKRVDRIHRGDVLDATKIDFGAGSFDLIVLSHVLEHFADPERVLDRCRHWLDPAGQALIALPNIRHLSVLKQLLVDGDFRYTSDGILDRTHLRFYTRASARRFIESNGFTIVRERGEIAGRRWLVIDRVCGGLAREFTAFAYNFLVKPA